MLHNFGGQIATIVRTHVPTQNGVFCRRGVLHLYSLQSRHVISGYFQ